MITTKKTCVYIQGLYKKVNLKSLTLDAVVVEVQVLQVSTEARNRGKLIVGELQVQQGGYVEHIFGNSFITQLVVVQPHERQVREALEVVSEKNDIQKGQL